MPRAVDKSQVHPIASLTIFLFARLVTLLTPFAQFFAFTKVPFCRDALRGRVSTASYDKGE
jgi:hypothetical protein